MRWLEGITGSIRINVGRLHGTVGGREAGMLQSMGSQRVGHDLVTEQQQLVL